MANKKNEIFKLGLMLLLITAIAGLLLAVAYEGTAGIIKTKKEEVNRAAYLSVLDGADADSLNKIEVSENAPDTIVEAYSAGEYGYAVKVTGTGYGGTIEIAVGFSKEGTVTGVSIVSSSETAGLGQKAGEPAFKDQYQGKTSDMDLVVTKQAASADNEISAISGATITSKAVTAAINDALDFYESELKGVE